MRAARRGSAKGRRAGRVKRRSKGKVKVDFLRHELRCPKGGKQPRGQGCQPRGEDGLSAHRRPGYPLSGCVPAEPDSVSPGGKTIRQWPTGKRGQPAGASVVGGEF